jgi:hypothetical protein
MKNANAGTATALRATLRAKATWLAAALALAAACVPYKGKEELNQPDPGPGFGADPGPRGFPGGSGTLPTWLKGTPVSSERALPPISGGTLLILDGGNAAFAADPDRDELSVVDLLGERLVASITLEPGDEPGRAVQTGPSSVVVLLRGSGAAAQIDLGTAVVVRRQAVCPAPRGIDRDAARGVVVVACAGGELVTLAADTLAEQGRVMVARDLRDVVVSGGKLFVSRFRSAQLLVLDASGRQMTAPRVPPGSMLANLQAGALQGRSRPTSPPGAGSAASEPGLRAAEPAVAWRLRPRPGGGVLMLHQEASNDGLGTQPGGYAGGGGCGGAMGVAVTEFGDAGNTRTGPQLAFAVLPVDFAMSAGGGHMAVVSAGNTGGGVREFPPSPMVSVYSAGLMEQSSRSTGGCVLPPGTNGPSDPEPIEFRVPSGQPVAVAFDGRGRVVVQTREPSRVEIISHRGGSVLLSQQRVFDTGRELFHLATPANLACASCHPEGTDDGHVWRFDGVGPRRSQSLRGGILKTAPFHWNGEMRDIGHLMNDVFSQRMSGPSLDHAQVQALGKWIDRLPPMPALAAMPNAASAADGAAIERGRALYDSAAVGCATCHSGAMLTNNQTVGVGTGLPLQVPGLRGVGWRAPFMHDGCAPTLLDRFEPGCGGNAHGNTATLSLEQKADLAAYLETL